MSGSDERKSFDRFYEAMDRTVAAYARLKDRVNDSLRMPVREGKKQCCICGEMKSLEEFGGGSVPRMSCQSCLDTLNEKYGKLQKLARLGGEESWLPGRDEYVEAMTRTALQRFPS